MRRAQYSQLAGTWSVGTLQERFWRFSVPLPGVRAPLFVVDVGFHAVEIRAVSEVPADGIEHVVEAVLQPAPTNADSAEARRGALSL